MTGVYEKPHILEVLAGTPGVTTDSQYIDTNFVDFGYWLVDAPNNKMQSVLDTPQTSCWLHVRMVGIGAGSEHDFPALVIIDDSANDIFRIAALNGNGRIELVTSTGTTTLTLRVPTFPCNWDRTYDIELLMDGTNGIIRVYADGHLIAQFLGDTEGAWTGRKVAKAVFQSFSFNDTGNQIAISECLWGIGNTTSPTLGLRVYCKAPTGAGTHTDWTGAYTDVDDQAVLDANVVTTSTAGHRITFTFPTVYSGISEYGVRTVILQAFGAGSGNDFKFSSYLSATNYDAASAVGVGASQDYFEEVLDQNPDTTAEWLKSDLSGAEFGALAT